MKTTNKIMKTLFGAVLSVLAIFGSAISTSAQTPDGRIVFSHAITGQIHAMDSDGSDSVQLTSGGGAFPAWSYDMRYVLFHRATTLEDTIYIMEARGERNGGRIFPVASNVGNTGVDWSPDARMIVFSGTVGSLDGLWIMAVNPETEELGAPVLVRAGHATAPVWSPDGTKIAFGSTPGSIIKVLDLATGVESFNVGGYGPSFSPDGSRIAFKGIAPVTKGGKTSWYSQIFVANADGTGIKQLTGQTDYVNFPKWSPDSTQLAFWHQVNGLNSIRKLTLATGTITLVKKGGQTLDWAP